MKKRLIGIALAAVLSAGMFVASTPVLATAATPTVPAKYQGSGAKNKMTWAQYQQVVGIAQQMVAPMRNLSFEAQLMAVGRAVTAKANVSAYGQNLTHYADPYGLLVLGHYTCAGSARTVGLLLDQLGIAWTHVNPNKNMHQWAAVTRNGRSYIVDGTGGAGWAIWVANPKVYPTRIQWNGTIYVGVG